MAATRSDGPGRSRDAPVEPAAVAGHALKQGIDIVPGAEISRYSTDRRGRLGGAVAGHLAGALLTGGNALLNPIVVLPALLLGLTGSWYVIAAPAALAGLGWLLGGSIGGFRAIGERPALWSTVGNLITLAFIVAMAFAVDRRESYGEDDIVRAVLVSFTTYVAAVAIATRAGTVATARIVPARRRAAYFATRALAGGVVAIGLSLVAASLYSSDRLTLPAPFAILFVIAGGCLVLSTYFQWNVGNGSGAVAAPAPRASGEAGPLAAYAVFRGLVAAAALADPFLIVYALSDLQASPAVIGLYVAVLVAARLLTEPLWSRLAASGRLRPGLQLLGVLRLLIPALALTLPELYASSAWSDRVDDADARGWLFGAVFALIGIAHAGQARLSVPYLDRIGATTASRQVVNIVVGVACLAPFAGAWVYGRFGFEELMLTAGGAALLGILSSGALARSPGLARPVAGAWRLRGERTVPTSARRGVR